MKKVTIGNVEVMPLQDAMFMVNPRQFLPAHGEEFAAEYAHAADERGLLPMSITCYLLRSAGQTILVDSGIGPRKRGNFPTGRLDTQLTEAGVDPGEIDLVLNTHLHIDHVGWNTFEAPDGKPKGFFPNARFVIQQREYDHWMRPQFTEMAGQAHLLDCVKPIVEAGKADFVSGEQPVDENLTFVATPGHTPGHVAVGIASAGERAIIIGDASHHPVHLMHPDWSPGIDSDGVLSAQTRARLFDDAEADGRTLVAGHWPYPGIGRILRLEGKRVFQAL